MVLLSLLAGFLCGFALSIPPGPISVAVIKQGVQGNFERGLKIGIGAGGMDFIYATIAVFASSAIVGGLADFVRGHGWVEFVFQIVMILVLVALGYRYMQAKASDLRETTDEEESRESWAAKLGVKSPYMLGVLIALANLANPPFLPTLIGVAAFLQANGWIGSEVWSSLSWAVGFGIGVLVWFTVLLKIILQLRTRLPATYFAYIFRFAGGAFFLFAAIITVRVLASTEW